MRDPELAALAQKRRARTRLIALIAAGAMVATTAPALILALLARDDEPPEEWVRLASVSQLAEHGIVYVGGYGIFLVDDAAGALALYEVNPGVPGADRRVLFCRPSATFEALHGTDRFDRRGILIEGVAPRGLDRFDVRVTGGAIEVNVRLLYRGPPRGSIAPLSPADAACGSREADPGFLGDASDDLAG